MRGLARRGLKAAFFAAFAICLCHSATGAVDRAQMRAVAQARYGEAGVEAMTDWMRLIDLARDQSLAIQLSRVNEFFNGRTIFQSDVEVWQQADYWSTPLESLVRGRGDCEDFAIAKYVSLLALGVPEERLRLVYVRARFDGASGTTAQAHMVLGYYPEPDAEPQILDNLVGDIQPASQRQDLTPIFSFNGQGLWAGGIKAASDPTERLSRWRDLLARLREEGFL